MRVSLHLMTRHGPGRLFDLAPGRHVIGRSVTCDVRVSLPSVAPKHAVITVGTEGATIERLDDDAKWLTRIDDDELISGTPVALAAGHVLAIGSVRFEVAELANVPQETRVEVKPDSNRQPPVIEITANTPDQAGRRMEK